MKKYLSFKSPLLMAIFAILLLLACQKEQVAADDTASTGNEATVNGRSSSGLFEGSINRSYADALADNFARKYDDANQTIRVAFSEKELSAFIASLKTRYKSDIIYVNFGVYGIGADPVNDKDNGRMTVFFTGNNMPKNGGSVTGFAISGDEDEFLNHGQIFP